MDKGPAKYSTQALFLFLAKSIQALGQQSPGYCAEILHLYLAEELEQTGTDPDEDEFLNVETMAFDELLAQVMDGTITDAKTVAATLKTRILLSQ